MSARWSTARPRTCSGAMYAADPSTVPGIVATSAFIDDSGSGAVTFARPKSRILMGPSLVTKRLSGLRSRCTMPFAWAAARPRAI